MEELSDGYDVEVVDKACDDFYCMICKKLMHDAIEMKCGHSLCSGCLEKLFQSFGERRVPELCPQCRCQIVKKKVRPAMTVRRSILSLKVKCINLGQGCTWQDRLENLKVHLEENCLFTEIACYAYQCFTKVLRRDIDNHYNMCVYRLILCQYCNEHIRFKKKQLHFSNCLMYPVSCTNCGVVCARREHLAHLDVCPLQEIECPYKNVGCDIKIIRNQKDAHLKTSSENHMLLLSDDLKNCKTKLTETVVVLNRTVEKLNVTEEKLVASEANFKKIEKKFNANEAKLQTTKRKLDETEANLRGPIKRPIKKKNL